MTPHLAVRNLCKSFGSYEAIRNVSFDVHRGEFVSLLGPSGCGKTTILRMLAGLEYPDSGTISVDGRILSSGPKVVPPERRQLGMVFQNYATWPHMTVSQNVAFGLRMAKLAPDVIRQKVTMALTTVDLLPLAARYPHELSGGQQQRVALGRCIVTEPTLILLDEPLSNLDAKLRDMMRFELKSLQQALRFTAIYVTHDQSEAMSMSDKIVLLNKGVIEQEGAPRHIYERPDTPFAANFVGSANLLPAVVKKLPAEVSGTGLVEIVGGPVISASFSALEGLRDGSPGACVIRPEKILVAAAPSDAAKIPARVVASAYLGAMTEYQLEAFNRKIVATTPSSATFSIGATVHIGFDEANPRLVAPVPEQALAG